MALRFLSRKDLAEAIEFPRQQDPAASIKILAAEEVERLIREAPVLQDRLLVQLFHETGARRGELANVRIRDIQFDEYGAIVWLDGKTGTRTRRVYACVPDLRGHINNHPQKMNPDAPLFFKPTGQPYTYETLYRRIRKLGKRILGKDTHPHMFRHTKATEDSRHFTDREMMLLFGWKGPQMVSVYSHLSMRDVEDKDLVLHGLKSREEALRPLVQVPRCLTCGRENAPVAIYCVKCGGILMNEQIAGLEKILSDQSFVQRLFKSKSFQDSLREALREPR